MFATTINLTLPQLTKIVVHTVLTRIQTLVHITVTYDTSTNDIG